MPCSNFAYVYVYDENRRRVISWRLCWTTLYIGEASTGPKKIGHTGDMRVRTLPISSSISTLSVPSSSAGVSCLPGMKKSAKIIQSRVEAGCYQIMLPDNEIPILSIAKEVKLLLLARCQNVLIEKRNGNITKFGMDERFFGSLKNWFSSIPGRNIQGTGNIRLKVTLMPGSVLVRESMSSTNVIKLTISSKRQRRVF